MLPEPGEPEVWCSVFRREWSDCWQAGRWPYSPVGGLVAEFISTKSSGTGIRPLCHE